MEQLVPVLESLHDRCSIVVVTITSSVVVLEMYRGPALCATTATGMRAPSRPLAAMAGHAALVAREAHAIGMSWLLRTAVQAVRVPSPETIQTYETMRGGNV